ncbi:MAG: PQQ-binding-like beta-propeller repeat protein, partial [bacterium]|nr:PQQ-binding-like beta-propeller repeat protein [bacterium]
MKAQSGLAATAAVALLTLATAPASGVEHDWPQWSGPHGNLTSVGNDAFPDQGFALEIAWSKALGSGYSGIAVAGDRLVTAFSDGESDFLAALDAGTGKELWRYRIAKAMKGHEGSDDGPLGSPTLADGMVYGLGPWGHLFAVRLADGGEVWSHQIVDELGARSPVYGFGSSPAVAGDVLVVATGGDGGRSISGFDRGTGELMWSTGDDMVGYQTPTVLTVGGRRQVVAATNRRLLGLIPETGRVLWQHEHGIRGEGIAYPVLVEENRILLNHMPEAALFQVTRRDGKDAVEEVWRSDALRDLNFPLPWKGHLYGYRGRFLTCVDASTGKTVWKSRPPGAGNLVLIDGHLVIQARSGDLVIAAATPEGYREEARLKTLDSGYFNPLGFAAGRIFARNRTQITSARIVEGPAVASSPAAAPTGLEGMIAKLVRKVEAAADKKAVIDEFMSAHQQFPIIEGEDLVHFVYRGEVVDLALAGNMLAGDEPMHRISGTDFYYRSLRLEPRAHFLYNFEIFEDSITDPLNPRRFGSEGSEEGEQSELAMPGWELPRHLAEPPARRGRIEKLPWKSKILDNERQVRVYLPPGYDTSQERYPLLLVAAGGGRGENDPAPLALGRMDHSLDHLIGESVAPLVVAFVTLIWPDHNPGSPQFAKALAEELIPLLDH